MTPPRLDRSASASITDSSGRVATGGVAAAIVQLPGFRTLRSPRFRLVLSACLLLLSVIAAVQLLVVSIPGWNTVTTFKAVMEAGRLFWAGQQTYGQLPTAAPDQVLTTTTSILYPPTHFLLLWPVIVLPHNLQVIAWLGLYVVAVPAIMLGVYSTLGRPSPAEAMLVSAMFLASFPLRVGLENGEIELLIAGLVSAAMVAHLRRRDDLGGMALAAAILLKPTVSVLLLLYFAWKRATRLVVAAAGIVAVVLLGTLAVGWAPRWLAYAALMGPVGRGTAWTPNQSVNGLVLRLLVPASSGMPIAPLPLGTEIAVDLGRVAVLLLMVWLISGNRLAGAEREWSDLSLALLALPLLQPYAIAEHWTASLVVIPVTVRLITLGRLRAPAVAGLVSAWFAMMASNFVLFFIAHHVPGPRLASEPLALLFSSSLLYVVVLVLVALGLGVRTPGLKSVPAAS